MNVFSKIERYRFRLFLLFLLFLVVGYFGKGNFKSAGDFDPAVFHDPIQNPVVAKDPIVFEKDGFSYKLTPLYDYKISGLVVHRMDYDTWYSLSRTDKTFTTDFCMLWGENIKNGAFKNETLSVDQDFRFCLFTYWGGTPIGNEQFSNNHLIIRNPAVKKTSDEISPGDQISITGKLVNVSAVSTGNTEKYEPKTANWTTSARRDDTDGGACEILYVEKMEILKKGNVIYHAAYNIGKYGAWVVVFWFFSQLLFSVFGKK